LVPKVLLEKTARQAGMDATARMVVKGSKGSADNVESVALQTFLILNPGVPATPFLELQSP
jgi:uncharacterized protein YgbK (DUF1537 family)